MKKIKLVLREAVGRHHRSGGGNKTSGNTNPCKLLQLRFVEPARDSRDWNCTLDDLL